MLARRLAGDPAAADARRGAGGHPHPQPRRSAPWRRRPHRRAAVPRSASHDLRRPAWSAAGAHPGPGEASLAHHGVLFLDELSEFARSALEALRQPLEDRQVTIVRGQRAALLPTSFMLVAATNPCPCGRGEPRVRVHAPRTTTATAGGSVARCSTASTCTSAWSVPTSRCSPRRPSRRRRRSRGGPRRPGAPGGATARHGGELQRRHAAGPGAPRLGADLSARARPCATPTRTGRWRARPWSGAARRPHHRRPRGPRAHRGPPRARSDLAAQIARPRAPGGPSCCRLTSAAPCLRRTHLLGLVAPRIERAGRGRAAFGGLLALERRGPRRGARRPQRPRHPSRTRGVRADSACDAIVAAGLGAVCRHGSWYPTPLLDLGTRRRSCTSLATRDCSRI